MAEHCDYRRATPTLRVDAIRDTAMASKSVRPRLGLGVESAQLQGVRTVRSTGVADLSLI